MTSRLLVATMASLRTRRRSVMNWQTCGLAVIVVAMLIYLVSWPTPVFREITTTTSNKNRNGNGNGNGNPLNHVDALAQALQAREERLQTQPAVDIESVIDNHKQEQAVLCYGDSLTAGVSDPYLYPYAKYLQARLGTSIRVTHRGNPGWDTQQMLDNLDNADTGLLTAMPADVVILLAGTNDLALGDSAEIVVRRILGLHQQALEAGGARHTVAIAIPQSNWQLTTPVVNELANKINDKIRHHFSNSSTTTLVNVPFDRSSEHAINAYFHLDGTHFTDEGYKVLGEFLAPVVTNIMLALQ